MKKIIFILTFIFFATQIVPIKYVGYLYSYELNIDDDIDNEEENPNKAKEKAESEFDFKLNFHCNYQISVLKTSRNKYPSFCVSIPDDYITSILIPPPNNATSLYRHSLLQS